MKNKNNQIGFSFVLLAALASGLPAFAIAGVHESSTLSLSAVTTSPAGARVVSDPQLRRAVTLLEESRKADEVKNRRKFTKPSSGDKVVRHWQSNENLITGGAEAFPM